jgi:small subunit ribosomal protein S17
VGDTQIVSKNVGDKESRGIAKVRQGVVVSSKMDKTVVVAIVRRMKHAAYGKYVKITKKYFAHDESNQCQEGDVVDIVECRPLSKNKRWRVKQVVNKAV